MIPRIGAGLAPALCFAVLALLLLTACGEKHSAEAKAAAKITAAQQAAMTAVSDIVALMYADAASAGETLQQKVRQLLANPTTANLKAAREAYSAARVAYQPSEFMRFDEAFIKTAPGDDGGLASVDSWEGQVNAWPLDEALIDYVSPAYSGGKPANNASIIGSKQLVINGEQRDTSVIDRELLVSLNEIGGSEANVATGYHAIEFLLWGQDLSQAKGRAGQRPATDYATGAACTGGNCDRRGQYLTVVTELLVADLNAMAAEWQPGNDSSKTLRSDFLSLAPKAATQRLFYGIGSIALGETASERMRVARISNSPEDEHECFSDLSHRVYHADGVGIQAAYRGEYRTANGKTAKGSGLAAVIAAASTEEEVNVSAALDKAMAALGSLRAAGDHGETFDYLIAGNDTNKLVANAEAGLIEFTAALEQAAKALDIRVDSDGGSLF